MDIEKLKQDFEPFVNPVADEPDKVNYDMCKWCSKKSITCCEHLPCYLSPDDVKDKTFQGICALIDTGTVSLDWWEDASGFPSKATFMGMFGFGDSYKGFFLRMRGKGRPIVHPAVGIVECVMLGEDGCVLDFCHRPQGGRTLIPRKTQEDTCQEGYSKKACADDWTPYHDVLQQVYEKYYLNDKTLKIITDIDTMASMAATLMLHDMA